MALKLFPMALEYQNFCKVGIVVAANKALLLKALLAASNRPEVVNKTLQIALIVRLLRCIYTKLCKVDH